MAVIGGAAILLELPSAEVPRNIKRRDIFHSPRRPRSPRARSGHTDLVIIALMSLNRE